MVRFFRLSECPAVSSSTLCSSLEPGVWIGTSGYSYEDWVGEFYPYGTSAQKMLPIYCKFFPLVELNFTFYRPPTRQMLERLANKTPKGFSFLVKLPQSISHNESPLDLPGFRHAVEGLAQLGKLAGVLCQFPQSRHCTKAACSWVETISRELRHLHLAVEFRHRSWNRPGLVDWLAEREIDLVAVDVPEIAALFPRGWMQSTSTAYIRLHSRQEEKWYAEGQERYDYDYSDEELGEWVDELSRRMRAGTTQRAMFLFNNCQRSQAAINARRMQAILGSRAPQLRVIEPFRAKDPVQMTLF
jgi:uncharacterized protein YecE (DUF72 family)